VCVLVTLHGPVNLINALAKKKKKKKRKDLQISADARAVSHARHDPQHWGKDKKLIGSMQKRIGN
jgi:hypothetical protein